MLNIVKSVPKSSDPKPSADVNITDLHKPHDTFRKETSVLNIWKFLISKNVKKLVNF